MKHEPLDGKKVKGIMYEESEEYFYPDDVKSAVMGLKTELDTWFDVNQDSWESGYVYPHLKKRVFEIIDKWFKDVIE